MIATFDRGQRAWHFGLVPVAAVTTAIACCFIEVLHWKIQKSNATKNAEARNTSTRYGSECHSPNYIIDCCGSR